MPRSVVRLTMSAGWALALLACAACSHDSATIVLVTDDEAGTFTQDPVPTTLQIDEALYASDGGVSISTLVDATLPVATIDLGNRSESTDAILAVSEFAASGQAVVYGASVLLDFGLLSGMTVPIFVQRTGQFARLPGALSDSRTSPLLAVFNGDTLLIAGGDQADTSAETQLYDFTQLAAYSSPPSLPVAPQSIAFQGTVSWLFDGDAGSYFDFSDSYQGSFGLPSGGGSFADIAGGATIVDPATGNEYIVGGTRTSGNPSKYVLEIVPTDTSNSSYKFGNPHWITLGTPRLGAAAVWLTSQDALAIIGGNTDGDAGAGVELIAGGSTVIALPYPPDPTSGAGGVVLDGGAVLVVGGVIPGADGGLSGSADVSEASDDGDATAGDDAATASALRVVDPTCESSCAATPWGPSLPLTLVNAQAFTTTGVSVLIVGNDATGATHVYTATSSGITEIHTLVPHLNARAITSPTQSVLVVGGSSRIESFTP
ncbi:MAG TPA: hypothetical protein VEK07_08490 [Polyangiaceae bacterium]|nr:hypothetical protein [Polyangiaceae bacterium]